MDDMNEMIVYLRRRITKLEIKNVQRGEKIKELKKKNYEIREKLCRRDIYRRI